MTSPNPRPNMMYEWRGFPYPTSSGIPDEVINLLNEAVNGPDFFSSN
jgi:hypothetical protein